MQNMGLNIAYLTKYVYLDENQKTLSNEDLKQKTYYALRKLFPERKIEKIVKIYIFQYQKMHKWLQILILKKQIWNS